MNQSSGSDGVFCQSLVIQQPGIWVNEEYFFEEVGCNNQPVIVRTTMRPPPPAAAACKWARTQRYAYACVSAYWIVSIEYMCMCWGARNELHAWRILGLSDAL